MRRNIFLYLISLIVLSFIFHFRWFSDGIFTYGDWVYQYPEALISRFSAPQLWVSLYSQGHIWLQASSWPIVYFYGLLGNFGYDSSLSGKIFYFIPITIFGPIGIYLLIRSISLSRQAGIIGSIVFISNTYFLHLQTSFLTLAAATSLAPWVIVYFIKSIKTKSYFHAILSGIFAFAVSVYEFRGFYILAFILFFYIIFFLATGLNKSFKSILISATPIALVTLGNIYWIISYIKIGVATSNMAFDRPLFGNEFLNIKFALSLFHPFWTGNKPAIFEVQSIPYYFWIIPLFAFLGLFLNRKNKDVVFFGIIAILGIFLTKQVSIPFSGIYPWLYENFPGFNAFREASKFFFLITIGYSVLIAGFIDWIWKNWKQRDIQTFGKYLLTFIIAFIFLWNTKPLITGDINTLFIPRTLHEDYLNIKNKLLEQENYSRTLWIPTFSRFSFYNINHPAISAVNMITGNWNTFINTYRSDSSIEGRLMVELMNRPIADKLLDLSSVKYVIVPLRDTSNNDDFFIHYGGHPPVFYIDALDELNYLKRIDIGAEELAVYENADFRPHIYVTYESESINSDQEFTQIEHEMINPTEYKIRLEKVSDPLYLNFSESFHPQWKLRIGEFKWWDTLVQKYYFVNDDFHFKNDAQLNSFRVDPNQVCKDDKVDKVCKVNSDGSYDIEMTIYFRPQSYMYLGLVVSGTTATGIVTYLIITLVRRYRKK